MATKAKSSLLSIEDQFSFYVSHSRSLPVLFPALLRLTSVPANLTARELTTPTP